MTPIQMHLDNLKNRERSLEKDSEPVAANIISSLLNSD